VNHVQSSLQRFSRCSARLLFLRRVAARCQRRRSVQQRLSGPSKKIAGFGDVFAAFTGVISMDIHGRPSAAVPPRRERGRFVFSPITTDFLVGEAVGVYERVGFHASTGREGSCR